MPTLTETLAIVFDADGTAAVREFQKVGSAAEKELGRAQSSADRWASSLTSTGAAMIGLGTVLVGGLAMAAKSSETAVLAQAKLENTLANMPKLAGSSSEAFLEQADAIQQVTAASADQVVSAQAMLGTFNLTEQQILDMMPLVVDYARKFGVDMTSAAAQVGKAVDGQIGALKRNGVSIDELLYRTDRFAAVTQALRDQVGGFAEQEGKTFSGQLAIMRNEVEDLVEGIGGGATEAFRTMLAPLQAVSGAFQSLSPEMQGFIGKAGGFASMGLIVAGGASMTVGWLLKMRDNFVAVKDAVSNLISSAGPGRMAAIAGGTAVTTAAVVGLGLAYEQTQKRASDAADAFVAGIGGDVTTKLAAVNAEIDRVNAELSQYASLYVPLAGEKAYWSNKARGMREYVNKLEEARGELEQQKAVADAAAASTGVLGLEQQEAADATLNHLDAAKQLTTHLREAIDPLFAATNAAERNRDAQQRAAEAQLAAFSAQVAYNDAVAKFGPASAEAQMAAVTLATKQSELESANRNVASSALDVSTAQYTLKAAVENGTVTLDAARAMLDNWVAQGLLTQEQANNVASSFAGVVYQASQVPDSIHTNVTADTSQAEQRLGALMLQIAKVAREVTVRVAATGGLPGHASGGTVADGWFVVGERGPELGHKRGSRVEIFPHEQSRRMLVPAGGGSTINVTVNGVVGDQAAVGRAIVQMLERYERARR